MKKAIFLGMALIFILSGCSDNGSDALNADEAKQKAEGFVNDYLIGDGQTTATVADISETEGLYQLKVQVNEQTIDAYMTKDGKTFFPQGIDMENPPQQNAPQSQQQQQQQMSPGEQAESMVSQGRGLLEQYGDSITEEERNTLETRIDELEELNAAESPNEEELQNKMQEVQEATQPMIEAVQQQQQNATGTQAAPQQ
jgi:molecular chaperone DnaK (HSP70)